MIAAKHKVVDFPVSSGHLYQARVVVAYAIDRGSVSVSRVGTTADERGRVTTARAEPGQAVYLERKKKTDGDVDLDDPGNVFFPTGAAGHLLFGQDDLERKAGTPCSWGVVLTFHNDTAQPAKAQLTILRSFQHGTDAGADTFATDPPESVLEDQAAALNTDLTEFTIAPGRSFTYFVLLRDRVLAS